MLPEKNSLFACTSRALSPISSYSKAQFELHSFFVFLTDVVQQWYITECYLYKGKNYCLFLFSFVLCTYFNVCKWHKRASWEKHSNTLCIFLNGHDKQYHSCQFLDILKLLWEVTTYWLFFTSAFFTFTLSINFHPILTNNFILL